MRAIWVNDDYGNHAIYLGELPQYTTLFVMPSEVGVQASLKTLTLNFSGLITISEMEAIEVVTPDWSATPSGPNLTLKCSATEPPSASAAAPLAVTLSNVTASTVGSGWVIVAFPGAGYAAASCPLQVIDPPSDSNDELELTAEFVGTDIVYVGEKDNTLVLNLTNAGPDIPATDASIKLQFNFGSAAGDLTDPSDGSFFTVQASPADSFTVNNFTQGANPFWTIVPTGPVLLAANDSLVLTISDIAIPAGQHGIPRGITAAFLTVSGVTGYNDAAYAPAIAKVSPISISSFKASPKSYDKPTTDGVVPELTFTVEYASFVTISNTDYQQGIPGKVTDSVTATIYETTAFTLIATNFITGQVAAKTVTVTVAPSLWQLVPYGTILMWHGAVDMIPPGWALCNGSNKTPDLRNRFVLCTDGSQTDGNPPVHAKGGTTAHTHQAVAAVAGQHAHGMYNPDPIQLQPDPPTSGPTPAPPQPSSTQMPTNPMTLHGHPTTTIVNPMTLPGGAHSHGVTNLVADVLPPWEALCYIMKTTPVT